MFVEFIFFHCLISRWDVGFFGIRRSGVSDLPCNHQNGTLAPEEVSSAPKGVRSDKSVKERSNQSSILVRWSCRVAILTFLGFLARFRVN